jgi:hypothetical protein
VGLHKFTGKHIACKKAMIAAAAAAATGDYIFVLPHTIRESARPSPSEITFKIVFNTAQNHVYIT